jgi:ATP-binding cassette subfamily B protein
VNYINWICTKIHRRIPRLVLKILLIGSVSLCTVLTALTTKRVVNCAIASDGDGLLRSAAILVCLGLYQVFGNVLSQYLHMNLQEDMERDFKRSILHTILRTDYSAIADRHSGDLIQRLDADAAAVFGAVNTMTTALVTIFVSLVGALSALLRLTPVFTVIFVFCGLLALGMAYFMRKVLKRLSKESSAATGRVSGFLHEAISKLMVVQALDMAREVEKRTDRTLDDRWVIRKKQRNMNLLTRSGMSILSSAGYLVTLLWCAWQLLAGKITPGDVTAITALVSTLQNSVVGIPMLLPQMMTVSASCDRIMELEALPRQTDPDPKKARAMYDTMTGFTADHLTFAYDRDPVMTDVSLTVPKGGLTVIVGQSGIGKSTLLKLLLGLYRPQSGSLTIDTPDGPVPVDRSTRSLFSYAPQGNFLLSGTIRENLTITNPQASEAEIRAALHASALDEYIDTLPLGLQTVLMENGSGLSEGQAQRLSLARAIISGAPVLLLDEVTSALDAATEATVLERICALPGRTCIAVTHRQAALALATSIIEVTENGMSIRSCE